MNIKCMVLPTKWQEVCDEPATEHRRVNFEASFGERFLLKPLPSIYFYTLWDVDIHGHPRYTVTNVRRF
jgi:hypothetical protein